MKTKTVFEQIRDAVDLARRRKKPIDAQILWGLMKGEVPEYSLRNMLSIMCRRRQVAKVPPKNRIGKGSPNCYEPGPVLVPTVPPIDRISHPLGNMAHKRLVAARRAAREWAK